jgi:hypothetical protein
MIKSWFLERVLRKDKRDIIPPVIVTIPLTRLKLIWKIGEKINVITNGKMIVIKPRDVKME